jgi:hypothetical protein
LFNSAPTGQVPEHKHSIHQTLPTMTFLTGNFLLFQSQTSENMHLSLIFNSSQKDLTFPVITDPVTSFPPTSTSLHHLHNSLSTCQSIKFPKYLHLDYGNTTLNTITTIFTTSDGLHDMLISVKLHRIPVVYPHHTMRHVNSVYKFVKCYVQTEHTAVNLSFKQCH